MQYIIRYKKDHEILAQEEIDNFEDFKLEQDFPEFDSEEMEWGWTQSSVIPKYFKINQDHEIEELPFTDAVFVNGHYYSYGYKTIGNKVIPKTITDLLESEDIQLNAPFEHLTKDGAEIAVRTIAEVHEQKAIESQEAADNYLRTIRQTIDREIGEAISVLDMLLRTQDYVDWQNEEKPKDDPRQNAYREMRNQIAEIRQKYEPMLEYGRNWKKPPDGDDDVPTEENTVAEIRAWLAARNAYPAANATKAQLLAMVRTIRGDKKKKDS